MRRWIVMSFIISFVGSVGAQNLLTNGDFESWSGGIPNSWSISGSNLNTEQEYSIVHGGGSSCKLLWTTTSTRWIQQEIPVNAGAQYTFNFWAHDNEPHGRVRVYMRWYDAAGNRIEPNSEGDYSVDNPDWQELTLSASAPANAETVHVEMRVYDVSWGDSITSAGVYVDDASLTGGGGDITPPYIVSAFSWGENLVEVIFSEDLDETTAENAGNYSMDQGISITNAELDASDSALVHLTTSSQGNVFCTLLVSGVEDLVGNPTTGDTASFWGKISTISSARADDNSDFVPDKKGDIVTIEGTATVEWYIVSSSACFLQDATAGIMVWTPGYDPQISRGDIARVAGEVGQYTGTTQIKNVKRFEIMGQGTLPSPSTLSLSQFGEGYEGSLVRVDNVYRADETPWPESGNSANILITNESGADTVTLRIYHGTNIDGTQEPTWPSDIVGLMDQFDSAPFDEGYQILPRDMGDLTEVEVAENAFLFRVGNTGNPIKGNTQISFTLPEGCDISLNVYNLLGQLIAELANGRYCEGEHNISWSVRDISTGVYFVNLATGRLRKTQKVIIVK